MCECSVMLRKLFILFIIIQQSSLKSLRRGLLVSSSVSVPVDSSLTKQSCAKIKTCIVQSFSVSFPVGIFCHEPSITLPSPACQAAVRPTRLLTPESHEGRQKQKNKKEKKREVYFCQNPQK